jgi:hypothetical protein
MKNNSLNYENVVDGVKFHLTAENKDNKCAVILTFGINGKAYINIYIKVRDGEDPIEILKTDPMSTIYNILLSKVKNTRVHSKLKLKKFIRTYSVMDGEDEIEIHQDRENNITLIEKDRIIDMILEK